MTGSRDRGSVTVVAAVLIAAALGLAGVVGAVGGVAVARAHAQGAADLAALGAVSATVSDAEEPCAVADEVARRNTATLVRCELRGSRTVHVVVKVLCPPWGAAFARARTGLVGGVRAGP